jgi:cyclohexanone monooxygenase
VTALRWADDIGRWIIETNRGDAMKARFVVMANGPLHRPKLPGIPGIESYKGHSFHTSRWDYAYTGGTNEGGLTGLKDKVVGIIGTGATAVQCVPHLGAGARQLFVFQRTPSSIDVRNNRPTDPDWVKSLKPGWQQHRMDNFNILVSGGFADEDLVNDGWTDIIGNILLLARKKAEAGEHVENPQALVQLADFKKMEQVRARVDAVVRDPQAADALKPYYNQFCKRPCFHDEYLETFNRPNVTLVDTAGKGVERITEKGIVANGREYELDCLIYATGFEVGTDYTRRAGYQVYGKGGVTLTEKWRGGAATLHGLHVNGFPNCFVISNTQSGFSANFPHMMNEQAKHIGYILGRCHKEGIAAVEASKDAEDAWVGTIEKLALLREAFLKECTPGYYNNEGNVEAMSRRNTSYGAGPVAFTKVLEDWRAEGEMKGLELSRAWPANV